MKYKSNYIIRVTIILLIICITIFIGIKFININYKEKKVLTTNENINKECSSDSDDISFVGKLEEKEEEPELTETIEVLAVGDFLMHIDIVQAMYNLNTGIYNFDYNLELIKNYLNKADLTIANLETTLAGEESGYSGYPCFNSPDELADAMKNAGVNIVSNMSNHSLDKGEYGFLRTREVLKEKGFDIIGTRDTEEDPRYIIKDVTDIKVGLTCYGYTTEGYGGGRGLNGIPIPENLMGCMNTFNPYDVDEDLLKMKDEIKKMKDDGADVLIFYMHWGEEYQLEPNESQLKIAKFLANEGVDIIFGDHPHTVQPIDVLKSEDGSHETIVIYSLGNFISSQRTESIGNPYTEDGLIASVKITKNFKTGKITLDNPEYIPTWVKLNIENGAYYYQVVAAEDSDADYLDYYQSQRAIESFNRTAGIVESYDEAVEVFNVK